MSSVSTVAEASSGSLSDSATVSIAGRWVTVPAFSINGNRFVVTGKRLKLASVDGDEYLLGEELGEPDIYVKGIEKRRAPRVDVLTFRQKLVDSSPKYKYYVEFDSVAAVRTANFDEWWQSLPQESRKNVRRGQNRGVTVSVEKLSDRLVEGIMGVNNDSPVRQGKEFVHFGKTFEQVKFDQSSFLGRSDFICAYHENELIGFIKIVYSGTVASIVQILPKASHRDKRPANVLIAKTIELCREKGMEYLTYGRYRYGNKDASSLLDFKVRNGFVEIAVPRYYLPVTTWGALCLKLRLHRGILGVLPGQMIATALKVRGALRHVKRAISAR